MRKRKNKGFFALLLVGSLALCSCQGTPVNAPQEEIHPETTEIQKENDEKLIKQPEHVQQVEVLEINETRDALGEAFEKILSVPTAEFYCGYPLDESFLLWFHSCYGMEKLEQLADVCRAATDASSWYELTGRTLHVLWLDYCKSLGLHEQMLDRVTEQDCASTQQTVLSFTGDLNFDDRIGTMQHLKTNGLSATISDDLQSIMQGSDILMINNECTYSTRGEAIPGKAYTFRSDPQNVSIIKELGVDIAGIANNHVCDYGMDALVDTIETLEQADMPYVGAGRNLTEAKRPWYFVANGRKIAIVAATQIERSYNYTKEATDDTPGVLKTLDATKYVEVIEHAKKTSDIVIAFVHWGTEGTNYFEADQVALANQFVAAGADAIIGGHSHCLQGISYIEGVPIIYSLGNFWFGSTPTDGVSKKDTAIAQIMIDQDGQLSFRFVPCVQENRRTYLVTDEAEKERIIRFEQSLSSHVTIDSEGYVHPDN